MTDDLHIYETHDVKLCPLRHAIVPGPPSLIPGAAILEFKDVPCALDKCAWYFPNENRCAALQLCIELRALPSAIAGL